MLPRVHGSALFERGETQILGVTTLNMLRMEQMIDTLNPERTKRYMHNYNFPPYSTGETGRVGSPKRREIGHGALAERALLPVLPTREEFPYAIRQVSEALGSNGSTSMGSVCASTMALLDAGVPLKQMVAGIAMGLINEGGEYVTLTDILGAEDAFGDMDFKVAGTQDVITALQLDTKLDGIPATVLAGALKQAKGARLRDPGRHAGGHRGAGRDEPERSADHHDQGSGRQDRRGHRPQGQDDQLDPGRHRAPRSPSRTTARSTSAPPTARPPRPRGRRSTRSPTRTCPRSASAYLGTVVKTTTFGAFVSLLPGKDGLLHISQIRKLHGGARIENIDDVIKVGEKIQVEVTEIDYRGKLSLVPVEVVEREAAEGGSVVRRRRERRRGPAQRRGGDGGGDAPWRRRRSGGGRDDSGDRNS